MRIHFNCNFIEGDMSVRSQALLACSFLRENRSVLAASATRAPCGVRPSVLWGWQRHLDHGVRFYVCAFVGDITVGGGSDRWTLTACARPSVRPAGRGSVAHTS